MINTSQHDWYVYIVRCADNTFYTGCTTDVEKRILTHNTGKGAKYTRARLPVQLVFIEPSTTHSEALKREFAIKALSRLQKKELISQYLLHLT